MHITEKENNDLELHVQLSIQRHEVINARLHNLEERFNVMLKDFADQFQHIDRNLDAINEKISDTKNKTLWFYIKIGGATFSGLLAITAYLAIELLAKYRP